MGGALPEAELVELAREAGFTGARVVARYRSYEGTSAIEKLSADLRVAGATLFARKK